MKEIGAISGERENFTFQVWSREVQKEEIDFTPGGGNKGGRGTLPPIIGLYDANMHPKKFWDWEQYFGGEAPKVRRCRCLFRKFWPNFLKIVAYN